MDRIEREDPADRDGDSDGDDVVEQSGHRFPALSWSPPRGGVLAAAGLAAGLAIGLAGGYAAGERHAGTAASGTTASSATVTEPDAPVLDQSGAECSAQTGRELQLGVQVTNQTSTWLTLRQVKAELPLGGLRAVSVRWAPCNTVWQESRTVPGNQVPPGAIAWTCRPWRSRMAAAWMSRSARTSSGASPVSAACSRSSARASAGSSISGSRNSGSAGWLSRMPAKYPGQMWIIR